MKVHAFADILDTTIETMPVSGENVEVTQTSTYFGSAIFSSVCCDPLRTRTQSTTGTSVERDEFAGRRCVTLPILVQKDECPSSSLAGLPILLYSYESWILTIELRQRLNSFGTSSLRRIIGYRRVLVTGVTWCTI